MFIIIKNFCEKPYQFEIIRFIEKNYFDEIEF
jgi:hypothetical protein